MTCRVTVVEGLLFIPTVDWLWVAMPVAVNDDYILSEAVTKGTVTSRTLTFRSLRTSLAGMYECRGSVFAPSFGITNASNSSSLSVIVKGNKPNFNASFPGRRVHVGLCITVIYIE